MHSVRMPGRLTRASLVARLLVSACALAVSINCGRAAERCDKPEPYAASEIAASRFFSNREQTKFARGEPHYPLASGASARYCFSRGCTGQILVQWSPKEQQELRRLRDAIVGGSNAASELLFIKIAVLQMETWLFKRLQQLDPASVRRHMQETSTNFGSSDSDTMSWVNKAMASYDRFDKECATYAMEATQHLLVLANLGLLRHWNVITPVYRYGVPGNWTAGLENRETCASFRFDLNTRAPARHDLHVRGRDPAALALDDMKRYRSLFPGMDRI